VNTKPITSDMFHSVSLPSVNFKANKNAIMPCMMFETSPCCITQLSLFAFSASSDVEATLLASVDVFRSQVASLGCDEGMPLGKERNSYNPPVSREDPSHEEKQYTYPT
jgi:hypothetical protein